MSTDLMRPLHSANAKSPMEVTENSMPKEETDDGTEISKSTFSYPTTETSDGSVDVTS